ncbi:MAG: ASKHA domain-containing protein [Candidatus Thorarchaeota archaeon]
MPSSESLGISIDIGTTNITCHLINIETSQIIREFCIANPQREFGEEIISRLGFAKVRKNSITLTSTVRRSIRKAILTVLDDSNCNADAVESIVIVGNTVMHHLFFDLPTDSLLKPPYEAEKKDAIKVNAIDVELPLSSDTVCYSPPIIESYIGADAVAMMITSGFPDSETTLVSIDVGTNTELALLSEGKMWVTSAASGPAFEGMSIQCGMPGDIGAIYSVEIHGPDSRPIYKVIGDVKPSGICGTGVVSAIASMLDTQILLPRGSFNRSISSQWLVMDSPISHYIIATSHESSTGSSIILTQPDIRMLQQSKSAIRSAFDLLLEHANITSQDIQQLNLTGVFGSGLTLESAIRIGLFPALPSAKVQQIPDGAIKGADFLHLEEYQQIAEFVASEVTHINLTNNSEFKVKFAQNLEFPSK